MPELTQSEAAQIVRPTVSEFLKARKASLEKELAEINEALKALEEHPETIRVLDMIAKVGHIRY